MDLIRLLAPWDIEVVDFAEVGHSPRASRAWWVSSRGHEYVAKLTFDRRPFVEPGLAVAEIASTRGLITGRPIRTTAGELCEPVAVDEHDWTIALLERVSGTGLQPDDTDAEAIAGALLGRAHAALAGVPRGTVPADLLEWSAAFAEETDNSAAARVVAEIAARSDDFSWSVVYGDPSPEILLSAKGPALIDWGTPSWGPRLHDIAAWLWWLGEAPGAATPRELRFLSAYTERTPLSDAEVNSLELFGKYGAAFGF